MELRYIFGGLLLALLPFLINCDKINNKSSGPSAQQSFDNRAIPKADSYSMVFKTFFLGGVPAVCGAPSNYDKITADYNLNGDRRLHVVLEANFQCEPARIWCDTSITMPAAEMEQLVGVITIEPEVPSPSMIFLQQSLSIKAGAGSPIEHPVHGSSGASGPVFYNSESLFRKLSAIINSHCEGTTN